MVDRNKINSKLQSLKLSLSRLNELRELSREVFLSNFTYFDSAKYNLITAIESMIDICNHIISRENLEIPGTSSDSIKILVQHQVLPSDTQNEFVSMVKFRNKAVHLYGTVDDEEVYRILQEHLQDFDRFISAIIKHVYE